MGYVQAVVGKKKFLVQLEDVKNIDVGYFFLTQVCSEEEVGHEVNSPITYLPPKEGELLTIGGNTVYEGE